MARVLAAGIYMTEAASSVAHIAHALASSAEHHVVQRWLAIAPGGRGRFDLPGTQMVVTEPLPKFELLARLTDDAADFDYVLLCDDDVEMGAHFLDRLLEVASRHDFALFQPARTVDSYTDHPIVQIIPGLSARWTRFVEIGPVTCLRRDAAELLLPFDASVGMGWGLDLVWPVIMEKAGLRMGIVDAAPIAHRIRRAASAYSAVAAQEAMAWLLAQRPHLAFEDASRILEAYT